MSRIIHLYSVDSPEVMPEPRRGRADIFIVPLSDGRELWLHTGLEALERLHTFARSVLQDVAEEKLKEMEVEP